MVHKSIMIVGLVVLSMIIFSEIAMACHLVTKYLWYDCSDLANPDITVADWSVDIGGCEIGINFCFDCSAYYTWIGIPAYPQCVEEDEAKWFSPSSPPAGYGSLNGAVCKIRWAPFCELCWPDCSGAIEGKWDVSEQKCVKCSGNKQYEAADCDPIPLLSGGIDYSIRCESACNSNPNNAAVLACDDLQPRDICSYDGKAGMCDSDCYCVLSRHTLNVGVVGSGTMYVYGDAGSGYVFRGSVSSGSRDFTFEHGESAKIQASGSQFQGFCGEGWPEDICPYDDENPLVRPIWQDGDIDGYFGPPSTTHTVTVYIYGGGSGRVDVYRGGSFFTSVRGSSGYPIIFQHGQSASFYAYADSGSEFDGYMFYSADSGWGSIDTYYFSAPGGVTTDFRLNAYFNCVPKTCSDLGKNCGYWSNGCGGTLYCGTCSPGYTCRPNGLCDYVDCGEGGGADSPISSCWSGCSGYIDCYAICGNNIMCCYAGSTYGCSWDGSNCYGGGSCSDYFSDSESCNSAPGCSWIDSEGDECGTSICRKDCCIDAFYFDYNYSTFSSFGTCTRYCSEGVCQECDCNPIDIFDCSQPGNWDGDSILCNCDCPSGVYDVEESDANGNCDDGIDNDCDGDTDSSDSNCETCECSSGTCCSDGCNFDAAGTVCRPSAGVCDVAETCTGSSASCPADTFRPSSYECRASAGVCDVAEYCTGSSSICPTNSFSPSSTVCRASAGVCDLAEYCTGSSASCPSNLFRPSSYVCRGSAGICDIEEMCTGTSATCPGNSFRTVGYDCGECMECDGSGNCNYLCSGTESSCECISDNCRDCSSWYGIGCGNYSCSNIQRPVWECVSGICSIQTCSEDASCYSPCTLTLATIAPNCGSDSICQEGETISMSGTYTGDCTAADFFQIDASNGAGCDIAYLYEDMKGIYSTVSGGGVNGGTFSTTWTIPVIPSDCSGETVSATASALYDGGPPNEGGSQMSYTENVFGSFKMACECDDGNEDCCDGCDFEDAGTECRASTDPICDPSEYCTGSSADCPADDSPTTDGTPCGTQTCVDECKEDYILYDYDDCTRVCSGGSCESSCECILLSTDDCSDCSCTCGGFGVEESEANRNCQDLKDNDCDGFMDDDDPDCPRNSMNFTGNLIYSTGKPVSNSLIRVTIANETLNYEKSGYNETDEAGIFFVTIHNIRSDMMNSDFDLSIYVVGEVEAIYECHYERSIAFCNPV